MKVRRFKNKITHSWIILALNNIDFKKLSLSIILILFITLFLSLSNYAYSINPFSNIKISGSIRNDAIFRILENGQAFDDVLENKLVLRHNSEEWRFYADGRLYLYYGDITNLNDDYNLKLMRSFIRYSPEIGDFTIGKTYINLGNPGIFNPFEINKQINLSDVNYDKEGILAFEFDLPIGDMSGCKMYAGAYNNDLNTYFASDYPEHCYAGGASLWTNAGSFDFGFVGNRYRSDSNIAGFYFKGDLEVGLQGAYGYHFNDDFHKPGAEINIGIDYSFLDAHLVVSSIIYYNQRGAKRPRDYRFSLDSYFFARYYLFNSAVYIYDEFLTAEIGYFVNLNDKSAIIYPTIKYIIADGLSASFMLTFLTGTKNQEFSRDYFGVVNALFRVEAKF